MTTTLELVNEVAEFADISDIMDDKELTEALGIIVKLMLNPDIPAQKAVSLIVQLEAYAAKFAMLASYYTNVKKDDRAKKNLYIAYTPDFSISLPCDRKTLLTHGEEL
jgi:hypothetical protein